MYEMTIQLQTNSEKCLYEQIYEHIRREIREGKLLSGERLPSTRSLAEHLQVARSTVDAAYDQLLSEGYIEARPYRGFYVCPIEELIALEDGFAWEAGPAYSETAHDGESVEKDVKPAYKYDFSPYGIDMSEFPFGVWKRITKSVLTDADKELFAQGEPQGDYNLRLTISRYLHSSRGVNCTPEQIVVGAGNDYLLMLLEKILGRHVRIAMENPTYKRAYQIFQSFAYNIVTVDMDGNGMCVDKLRQENVQVAYVMPSHQYPTGTVMPIGRRTELLRWANESSDRYLIEDDYDSEFRYKGKPIPSLQASDEKGKVIYIGTFSKAIAPAIRVSYMVLPPKLLDKYRRECYFYSCTVSRIDQCILNEFIRDGHFERHLNRMRKIYKGKHDALLEALRPFEDKFKVSGEHAGLHILLTVKGKNSKDELIEKALIESAKEACVKVYGLSDSMVKEEVGAGIERSTVILGFGSLTIPEIRDGVNCLAEKWLH